MVLHHSNLPVLHHNNSCCSLLGTPSTPQHSTPQCPAWAPPQTTHRSPPLLQPLNKVTGVCKEGAGTFATLARPYALLHLLQMFLWPLLWTSCCSA